MVQPLKPVRRNPRLERLVIKRLRVIADATGGRIRKSARGIPHVVVDDDSCSVSIAYFLGANEYKVFWPWPSSDQQRAVRRSVEEVVAHVQEIRGPS